LCCERLLSPISTQYRISLQPQPVTPTPYPTLFRSTKKRDHERLVGDIRLQVRQAYFDVQRLQGQMDIAARALAIAEQEFSRARIRHDNGLVDPIALLEAEYQLEDARYQAYSARVGYLMAGQGLVMASGYFDIH